MKVVLPILFLLLAIQVSGQTQPAKILFNGIELNYIEQGQGDPVIFIHGGSGDYRAWEPQVKLFSANYHAIAYSRRYSYPNQNQTEPKNFSALTEAEDLAGLITSLKLGRVHLVGASYGGFAALELALNHPEMVRSLVLAEPPVHQLIRDTLDGEKAYQDFMRQTMNAAAAAFHEGHDREAMKILSNGISGPGRWESLTEEQIAAIMTNARFFKVLTASSDPFPDVPQSKLKQLRVPTLIITGETTTTIHRLVTAKLAQLIPNAKSITIPHAGHASNRDNPEKFNEAVREFLGKVKK